jgi:hypothetical protein
MANEDLPPPDVMDSTGRMRRLAIAFVLGVVTAAITYTVCDQLSTPDAQATTGAYKFVFYMTALVGAGVFGATLAILNHREKKRWREQLTASARVVK